MAEECCSARVFRKIDETILRMRHPARRAFGSVPNAVLFCAVAVGISDLFIGSKCLMGIGYFYLFRREELQYVAAYTAFATSVSNVVLVFGLFQGEKKKLRSIVCAMLALFSFCVSVPLILVIRLARAAQWTSMCWEIPRLLLYLLHGCLLSCLLAEVSGETLDAPSVVGPGDEKDGRRGTSLLGAHQGKGNSNSGAAMAHQPPVTSNIC